MAVNTETKFKLKYINLNYGFHLIKYIFSIKIDKGIILIDCQVVGFYFENRNN